MMIPDKASPFLDDGGGDPLARQAEFFAGLCAAKEAPTGFAERLVLFWSNHFSMRRVCRGVALEPGYHSAGPNG